jgi:hypothetical protein
MDPILHRVHLHNHDGSHPFGFWETDYWLEITKEGDLAIVKETGPNGSASANVKREKLDPTRWRDFREKAVKAINGLEMSAELREQLIKKLSVDR